MKHIPRKLLSIALAGITAASLTLAPFAAVIGEDLHIYETQINQGTSLSQGVFWGVKANDKRTEHYITYTPGQAVTPMITYGSKVTSTSTVSAAAKKLEEQGYRVVAGMNGDYYYTNNGVPMGLLVTEGILRSGYNKTAAIGFFEDGTAIMGDPKLSLSMTYTHTVEAPLPPVQDTPCSDTPTEAEALSDMPEDPLPEEALPEEEQGAQTITYEETVNHSIYTVNKARSATGIFLYTNDFNLKGTNGCTESGFDVVLVPAQEGADISLRLGGTLDLIVESAEAKTGATTVPEGKLVLSVNDKAPAADIQALKNLKSGMRVTLNISTPDPLWAQASYITSGYKVLLENGEVAAGLDTSSAPRTAIGMKSDGSLLFYTIDGRQSGHSVGASEVLLAQRLQQLGCTTALCLDGGGSTTLAATLPDSTSATLINKPSGGKERAVSTHIFLVADNTPSAQLDHYYISPVSSLLLAGAELPLVGTAVDSNFIPMNHGSIPQWSTNFGTVTEDGVYTAPFESGTATITLSLDEYSGTASVQVIASPDSIHAKKDGKTVTSLQMQAGEQCALELSALYHHMTLISQNECFTFEVTNSVGTITKEGVFTATGNGEGEIVIRAGECTLTIPVTVQGVPFSDVAYDAWYYDAVRFVYDNALMNGMSETVFAPQRTTNRAMIVQILYNREGKPESAYTGVFDDVADGQWYTAAVEWAAANGIVNGVGNGRFDPLGEITREQMAIILHNYASWVGYDTSVRGDVSLFSDADSIHNWAAEEMAWAVGIGLLQGNNNALTPLGSATRAQIAQVLINFETIFKDAPIVIPPEEEILPGGEPQPPVDTEDTEAGDSKTDETI